MRRPSSGSLEGLKVSCGCSSSRPLYVTMAGLEAGGGALLPGGSPSKRSKIPRKGIGAATTEVAPRVLWTPSDAQQYADDVNTLWISMETAIASCSSPFSLMQAWLTDYAAWSSFYAGASSWSLWWNSGTIDSWQDTANGWRTKVASACGSTNLPPGGPSDALSTLSEIQTAGAWIVGVGVVGAAVWFAWPWLTTLRKKNPRVRRRSE